MMPENKTQLNDFETLFEPRILLRAQNYWYDGAVSTIDEPLQGLYHAVVEGRESYDVDIRIQQNFIMSTACTCPYDETPYCKHIGAVLYELYKHPIESLKRQKVSTRDSALLKDIELPDDLANSFAEAITEWKASNSFNLFLCA